MKVTSLLHWTQDQNVMHKHKGFYASEAEGLGGNKCIYKYVLFLEWAKQRWKHCSEGGVVKIHVSLKDKKAIILQ